MSASIAGVAAKARPHPARPPIVLRARLSTSSCRMIRLRSAPRAARTAISRCRSRMRANRRLAMLAQAISSTSATAPSTTLSAVRVSPISAASSVCTAAESCREFELGYCFARLPAMFLRSWSTWATVTPGFIRPMVLRKCKPRFFVIGRGSVGSSSTASVVQTPFCGAVTGKRNEAGITPTTVYESPLSLMLRPRTDRSAPNCSTHSAWLISTTCVPCFSSSAVKPRPSSGFTPNVGRRSQETTSPSTCTGRASPVKVNELSW